ncbi:DUF2141 domain-containing protein [Dyadobacter chenwenxiniae]|uniref:DUF2141 domain-containing protein n=1 Tax=Dyadobacter chenwenxiniae TaxID=2906456 RepID=A0A9X1PN57_9BACT|nr:DUF2141 domain-containing protein [Dyadobacter chenwenxiniae]MCF0061536.1 DUF2141 domain-containing protein [Dyadobacter chenwenxiniae]UON81359.1 DUF2141 domain-containing protein [Dyadobacter chenwenxiniae]
MLVWIVSCLLGWFAEPAMILNIEFTNIQKGQGKLWIAIYKPEEKFAGKEKPNTYKIVEVKAAAPQNVAFELSPGRYALAVYHDLNSNGMLDKNFVGIPKEPYGFSKNFRPKFSAPKFEDCEFVLKDPGQKISVKLTD